MHEKVHKMPSLKMRNHKGLNNDIFDQQPQGYFLVVSIQKQLRKVFYNSILNNFENLTIKHMRNVSFVNVASLTLLKIDSSTGAFM